MEEGSDSVIETLVDTGWDEESNYSRITVADVSGSRMHAETIASVELVRT